MGLRREQGGLDERQIVSPRNGNVTGVCQLQHRQGVGGRLIEGTIAMDDAQPFHGKLRGRQGEQDGAGVVDSRIGVKEDLFAHVSPGSCG